MVAIPLHLDQAVTEKTLELVSADHTSSLTPYISRRYYRVQVDWKETTKAFIQLELKHLSFTNNMLQIVKIYTYTQLYLYTYIHLYLFECKKTCIYYMIYHLHSLPPKCYHKRNPHFSFSSNQHFILDLAQATTRGFGTKGIGKTGSVPTTMRQTSWCWDWILNDDVLIPGTLKLTASSPLKNDGWNTILSYWGRLFSGANC